MLIGQWYIFYLIDEEKTEQLRQEERDRAEFMGEEEQPVEPHYVFYESVDGSLIHPGDNKLDFESLSITQICEIDGTRLLPCPWTPAPADCWETGSTKVKAVMRRKLVDHYEIDTGGIFYFKGGFSIMAIIEDGALFTGEYDDEEGLELELDLDNAMAGLAFGASLILAVAVNFF